MSVVGGHSASGNLESMMALLSDPKALKEKFDQLAEAQRQAQEVLDKVGPAQDILGLRAQTQAQLDASKAAEAAATAQRAKLLKDAQTQATAMVVAAQTEANQIRALAKVTSDAAAEAERKAAAATSSAQSAASAAKAASDAVAARESALAKAQQALAANEADLDARIAAFHQAHKDFVTAITAGASGA